MNANLKKELLHQFTLRKFRCLTVNVYDLFYYLERIHKFGIPTMSDIRNAIIELHDEKLIRCVPQSNNVYDIILN